MFTRVHNVDPIADLPSTFVSTANAPHQARRANAGRASLAPPNPPAGACMRSLCGMGTSRFLAFPKWLNIQDLYDRAHLTGRQRVGLNFRAKPHAQTVLAKANVQAERLE